MALPIGDVPLPPAPPAPGTVTPAAATLPPAPGMMPQAPAPAPAPAPAAPVPPAPAQSFNVPPAPVPPAPVQPAPAPAQASAPTPPMPPAPGEAQLPATYQEAGAMAPAHSGAGNLGGMQAAAAAEGFEGLELGGFGTFPLISLKNDGNFESTGGFSYGPEGFYVRLLESRVKWIIKNGAPQGPTEKFVYSYDGVTTMKGEAVQDVLNEWKMAGFHKPTKKKYLDVMAQIVGDPSRPETRDGMLVILSVPEASIGRLSSYWYTVKTSGKDPKAAITHVCRGQKITNVQYPFYPWSFSLART